MPTRVQRPTPTASAPKILSREPPAKLPEIMPNHVVVRVDKRKTGPCLTAEQHHALIQVTAYHLAERRGFEPGHESEDWATAEALVIDTAGLPVT